MHMPLRSWRGLLNERRICCNDGLREPGKPSRAIPQQMRYKDAPAAQPVVPLSYEMPSPL
jgi:hypothetical protein